MIVDHLLDRRVPLLQDVSLTEDVVLDWRGGSALRACVLSSCFAKKKVAKEEGDPRLRGRRCRLPCATRSAGRLRNSALRASDSPRRRPPALLRCSALHMGTRKNVAAEPLKMVFACFQRSTAQKHLFCFSKAEPLFRDAFRVPLRGAEQRRLAGGFGLRLSEPQASLASRPASRVAQGTRVAGADPGVAFSLATFFWRSKRKYARAASAEPNGSASATSRLASTAPNRKTSSAHP